MLNRRLFLLLLIPLLLLTGCDIDIGLPTTTLTPLPIPASTATAVSQAVATATTAPQPTNTTAAATVAPTQPPATATSAAATATSDTSRNQAAGPTVTLPPGQVVPTPLPASPTPAVSSAIATCSADDDLPASRSSLGDAYFPNLGNSGYDALHYSLDLSVDMDSNTISGTTTMLALATGDLPGFNLDLNGMDVAAVLVNGAPAQFSRAESELQITPASPIAAGQQFTTLVSYSGVPSPGMEGGAPLEGGWNAYNNGVWVFNEPASAHTWYPVNDHPCDKATYDVRVDVPQPYVVAANGLLKNVEQQGNRSIYYWASRDPIASYLVTIDIEKFTVQTLEGPNGLPMRNYFPSFEAVRLEDTFGRMPEMIELFNGKFGPYPFEAYGVMVAGTNLGFAGEAQTISVFGLNTGQRGNADETIAHELAHQWFGDSISLKTWKDEWLKEGFATFAQWVWLEHVSGKDAVDQRMRQTYQGLQSDQPSPPADPAPDDLYNSGVYLRGGMTLMAIRHRVGDDTMFRILQTYSERYRYGNASTQDFINVAKEVSGQDLDALFDAWLHDPDLPPLSDVVDN